MEPLRMVRGGFFLFPRAEVDRRFCVSRLEVGKAFDSVPRGIAGAEPHWFGNSNPLQTGVRAGSPRA